MRLYDTKKYFDIKYNREWEFHWNVHENKKEYYYYFLRVSLKKLINFKKVEFVYNIDQIVTSKFQGIFKIVEKDQLFVKLITIIIYNNHMVI